MQHIRIHRAAVALTSGVAVASLVALSASASASTTITSARSSASSALGNTAAAAAASYLAHSLVGKHHDHYSDTFGGKSFPDQGETADAVLSLDAAGEGQAAASRATTWLQTQVRKYAGTAPNFYPGSLAKLLLVAEAQHVDVQSFGGVDLVGALVAAEGAGGAAAGEYQNPGDTKFGASVLVQSLAVLALADTVHAGAQPDAAAVTFLAGQQCPDGAFQVAIRPDPTTACDAASDDVDTTAYAVQALIAAGDRPAGAKAVAWLSTAEHPNGGWAEAAGSPVEANSTALAVEAFLAAHQSVAAGERWLHAQQLLCNAPNGAIGAVKYSNGKYATATALRATSQAGVALAYRSLSAVDRSGAAGPADLLLTCPLAHPKAAGSKK